MKHIKGLLLDLDGTLYFQGQVLPGAAALLEKLREGGVDYRCITNTSSRSPESIARSLTGLGLAVGEEKILSPLRVAALYLAEEKSCYFAGDPALCSCFSAKLEFEGCPKYTILGDLQNFGSYNMLDTIYRYLTQGSRLLTTSYSPYFIAADGRHLDTGAFARMFEMLTGTTAVVLGKPSAFFYEIAMKTLALGAEEILAVGDDPATDIKGARSLGITTVLVHTGKYCASDPDNTLADFRIDSLDQLIPILEQDRCGA